MVTLESQLSRHMSTSELSLLNRTGNLTKPSTDLLNILTLAEDISKKSSGSFDVTILPLLLMHESICGKNEHPDRDQADRPRPGL